jgi:hypothetical protein
MNNEDFEQHLFLLDRAFDDLQESLGGIVSSLGQSAADRIQAQDFAGATELAARCQRLKDFTAKVDGWRQEAAAVLSGSGGVASVQPKRQHSVDSPPAAARAPRAAEGGMKRRASETMRVIMPNGERLEGKNAARTMALALQRIGFERVQSLKETIAGVPLVARERHPKFDESHLHHQVVDGWHVVTNLPNDRKAAMLRSVAERLGVALVVEV